MKKREEERDKRVGREEERKGGSEGRRSQE